MPKDSTDNSGDWIHKQDRVFNHCQNLLHQRNPVNLGECKKQDGDIMKISFGILSVFDQNRLDDSRSIALGPVFGGASSDSVTTLADAPDS